VSTLVSIRTSFPDMRCPHYSSLRDWCEMDDYSCSQHNSCPCPNNWEKIWGTKYLYRQEQTNESGIVF
jgi:hypothetical protein